jgi:hypothetical protein
MKNLTQETQVFRGGEYFGVLVENPTAEQWAEAAESYDGKNYITENYDCVVVERCDEELVPVPRNGDLYEFFPPGAEYSEDCAESEAKYAKLNEPYLRLVVG